MSRANREAMNAAKAEAAGTVPPQRRTEPVVSPPEAETSDATEPKRRRLGRKAKGES